jgi:hypothetical protein
MKSFLVICGVLASLLCFVAGLWMIFGPIDLQMRQPVGLYFIGKGFFVGPALIAAAHKL